MPPSGQKSNKVIAVYSKSAADSKTGYAINLAAALAMVAETRVAFLDISTSSADIREPLKSNEGLDIGVDALRFERLTRQHLRQIKDRYDFTIIDISADNEELLYEVFFYADSIHFFVDSIRDRLKEGHLFLEDLNKKGWEGVFDRVKVVVNRLNIFDKFSKEEMSWLVRRDIWAVVPEQGILEALIDSKGMPLVLRSQASLYSKAVLRAAKSEAGKLLGLALGSGAAFGLAHVGILKTLEQRDVCVDVLSGSSIGALIASLWGLGFSAEKIERIAKRLKNKLNVMRLVDLTVPISGILAGKRLKRFLRSILGEKTFEDLQIPVKIMVYDLANRETLAIEKGSLVEAVYMSVAVPGIFEPTVQKERMFIDGGVSDPVPVDILLSHGINKIIAVNVLPGPEDIHERNMLLKKRLEEEEKLLQAGSFFTKVRLYIGRFFRKIFTPNIFDVIMTSMQSTEYILAENSCKKAGVVLHPVYADATSIDFHLVKDFIRRGEEEANQHIKEIEELAEK